MMKIKDGLFSCSGADLGGGCRGCAPPPPEMTCGFLIQVVFCKKNKTMWFIGVEAEQETSAPPPKKNPGSAPAVTEVTVYLQKLLKRFVIQVSRFHL